MYLSRQSQPTLGIWTPNLEGTMDADSVKRVRAEKTGVEATDTSLPTIDSLKDAKLEII